MKALLTRHARSLRTYGEVTLAIGLAIGFASFATAPELAYLACALVVAGAVTAMGSRHLIWHQKKKKEVSGND